MRAKAAGGANILGRTHAGANGLIRHPIRRLHPIATLARHAAAARMDGLLPRHGLRSFRTKVNFRETRSPRSASVLSTIITWAWCYAGLTDCCYC
jgi:hypothetical protein